MNAINKYLNQKTEMLRFRTSEKTQTHTKSMQKKIETLPKGKSTRKTKSGDKKSNLFPK